MPAAQNFKNHTRVDVFYLFALLSGLLNLICAIAYVVRHGRDHLHLGIWWIVMSFVLIVLTIKIRSYGLKVQDRVIRLEERLRLAALLPAEVIARSQALTLHQLIALRFASDAELPALVQRTLNESLTPKQIKEAIVTWRPDYLRV